jgi:hypothetical protein
MSTVKLVGDERHDQIDISIQMLYILLKCLTQAGQGGIEARSFFRDYARKKWPLAGSKHADNF